MLAIAFSTLEQQLGGVHHAEVSGRAKHRVLYDNVRKSGKIKTPVFLHCYGTRRLACPETSARGLGISHLVLCFGLGLHG